MEDTTQAEQEAIRKLSYSEYLSLFAEAAEIIKKDPVIRTYFPPTKSGIHGLAVVLHRLRKNTEKVIHGSSS